MTDRRLVWNQVEAPNLSGASSALANANQSFLSGLDAAQGVITKYGEGQVEKADNLLLNDLAGIGGETEFDAFVDSGGLDGRNISEDLRNHVLQMRTGIVNDAGTRSRTDSTLASTGIRMASEGRTAGIHADNIARRDFTRGNVANFLAAQKFARSAGDTIGPITEHGDGGSRQIESPTDAYKRSLIESGLFSASEVNKKMNPINEQAKIRTDEVAASDAEFINEQMVAANQDIINHSTILNENQMNAAVLGDPRFTASENEKRIEMLRKLNEQDPTRLRPPTSGTPELDVLVENTIAAAHAEILSTDQNRAISDIDAFTENPTKALIEALNLGKDEQSPGGLIGLLGGESGFDQNQLRNMINDYAHEFGVEPEIIAVAMRDAFNRDPFGRNTLENRFNKDDVKAAVDQLDLESIRNFRERESNNQLMEIELSVIQNQARNLQMQIEKTNSPEQKKSLKAQLSLLHNQVAIIEKRRQNQ